MNIPVLHVRIKKKNNELYDDTLTKQLFSVFGERSTELILSLPSQPITDEICVSITLTDEIQAIYNTATVSPTFSPIMQPRSPTSEPTPFEATEEPECVFDLCANGTVNYENATSDDIRFFDNREASLQTRILLAVKGPDITSASGGPAVTPIFVFCCFHKI